MVQVTFCFVVVLGLLFDVSNGFFNRGRNTLPWIPLMHETEDSAEIIGGDEVDIKQYPFQAGVFYSDDFYCGGSIISEEYIITCGYCVASNDTKDYQIKVGTTHLSEGGTVYNVSALIYHPYFVLEELDYNVALVRTTGKMKIDGTTVKPVQLANSDSVLKPGDNIVVTGWGAMQNGSLSNSLRALAMPVTTQEYCTESYKHLVNITDRMFCAGFEKGGKGVCAGDGGGPAVEEKSNVQYGLITFSNGCAEAGFPGGFINISALRDWIKEVAGV
ncbi:trypsin-1-like [Amyelois transitella]|uniref:trypsin-1-like n=1 Tax=Amyelois transitella TaxID=680683 RepID=UPI00299002B1|nr:trypsin-1-like [Amyelois transitella]